MEAQSRIDKKTIQKMAGLAMLSLTESEEIKYAEQLGQILNYVSQLDKVNTEGVPPLVTPVEMIETLRADVARDPSENLSASILEVAPDKVGPLFKVPPVL
jgi:aspartyl-tRNA(Asn)/glutamyl-tRNA(Gln) amidotransferase subunit C